MTNAIDQRLKIDKDSHQVRMIVNNLFHHILERYIARVNERDVIDDLFKFYTESDLTLISKQQLKVYQEYEKTVINVASLKENK